MTEEFDLQLTRLAANCPALWDRRSNDFKNKVKKQRLIKELARTLNTSSNIVQVRFRTLRDRYRKEKLKIIEKYGTDEVGETPWPLYKELRFLDVTMFHTVHDSGASISSDNKEIIIKKYGPSMTQEGDDDVPDFDDRLVDLLIKCPALWDKRCYAYRNKVMKDRAVRELAMKLNSTPKEVLARYRSLRDKYRREKVKKLLNTDDQNGESWHLLKPLSFLDAVQVPRKKFVTSLDDYSRDSSTLSDNEAQLQDTETGDHIDLSFKPGTLIQNPMRQLAHNDINTLREDFDDKLARLAGGCPALWDRRMIDYRNKTKREHYLKDLARTLNCSTQLIQTRFKSLREKYYREKAKMEAGASYMEPWHLLKTLSFLDDVYIRRKRHVNPDDTKLFSISQDPQEDCSRTSSVLSESEVFVEEIENPSMVFDLEEVHDGEIIEFLPARENATSSDIDNDVTVSETKVLVGDQTERRDTGEKQRHQGDAHIVAFGEYLMATLRRLPSDLCDETIFKLTDILRTSIQKSNSNK